MVGWGVVVVAWSLLRWTLWPSTVEPGEVESADAVVLFVGGSGERFDAALDLMAAGKASVLVVPNGQNVARARALGLCAETTDFEVLCPPIEPLTTRGEAVAIGRVAAERGWESVIAVTSSYHISRAELLLGRCFAGRIQAVGAEPDLPLPTWRRVVAHEMVAHVAYRTVARGC